MSIIEIDTNSLKRDVEVINTELQAINTNAEKLSQILKQLGEMWEGNAKQAFSTAVQDDILRLQELVDTMKVFTVKTSNVREEYDKCEKAVSQIVSSIKV